METMARDKSASAFAPDGAPVAPPCVMVIFGAAGDLTKRLVVPALYNLVNAGRLPNEFQLGGVDLASKTTEEWRTGLTRTMQEFVRADGEFAVEHKGQTAWQWLTERMSYLQGDLNDSQTFRRLDAHLAGLDKAAGTAGNRLFYLAIADRFFSVAVDGLGAAGLVTERDGQWRRVIIEKPFGHDLVSAKALNREILKHLREDQIYRIDHFLGKETVQNTGYETLIYDCMIGDATLFQRADNIEAGWASVQPILDAWTNNSPRDFPNYVAGGDGPAAADELLARDGRAWKPLA